jgi:hypothetical protein
LKKMVVSNVLASLPQLVQTSRAHLLAGDYDIGLQIHGQAINLIKKYIGELELSGNNSASLLKWTTVLKEFEAEAKLAATVHAELNRIPIKPPKVATSSRDDDRGAALSVIGMGGLNGDPEVWKPPTTAHQEKRNNDFVEDSEPKSQLPAWANRGPVPSLIKKHVSPAKRQISPRPGQNSPV